MMDRATRRAQDGAREHVGNSLRTALPCRLCKAPLLTTEDGICGPCEGIGNHLNGGHDRHPLERQGAK